MLTPLRRCRGFSLIELTIIFAVAAAVIGAIWVATSAVSTERKKQELQSTIARLIPSIEDLFQGSIWPADPSGQTDITQALIASGRLSSNINPISGTSFSIFLLYPPLSSRQILITQSGLTQQQANDTMYAFLQGQRDIVSYAYCSTTPETTWWIYNPPLSTPWPPACPANAGRATVYYGYRGGQ